MQVERNVEKMNRDTERRLQRKTEKEDERT